MGIFKFFKEFRQMKKMLTELPQQIEEQNKTYRAMTVEELAALSDEDLICAASARTEAKIDYDKELSESFCALSDPEKVFYAVNLLEMEVNNGGLCQFFVNSSRAVAPYISDYLGIIGAQDHKQLFDGFIGKHQIDLSDLSSFQITRVKDFEKQASRYPFDEYDDRFYELDSLETPLSAFVRGHVDAF